MAQEQARAPPITIGRGARVTRSTAYDKNEAGEDRSNLCEDIGKE
eukprot:CAMPEP_0184748854 /NCGR_PEP_ID=MMETSP0315-20130426/23289_1 /TAXON_ID=101924 /ORGANISM="Rhodosorus marinus, Strain UTEX LB 2760" /LENGTH=44 /DNA_ID= /DNA_START= /DNA_END= /DNA_ORIENTATION=